MLDRDSRIERPSGRRWGISFLVIGSITTLEVVPPLLTGREPQRALFHLLHCLIELPILMAVLSLAFGWGMRRRLATTRILLMNLAIAVTIGTASTLALDVVIDQLPALRSSLPRPHYADLVVIGSMFGLLHCGIWALVFVIPWVTENARLASAEAEQMRTAAELARLRSQLEPHFLLNTLNTIAGLVTEDAREARRLIACLGDLLRDSLRSADEWSTIGAEVAWLRRYAEILESRHSGALRFQWEIDDATRLQPVPPLLLQPLVENAVKHGALARRGGGRVVVRTALVSTRGAGHVVCTIEDNGPGLPAAAPRKDAFGLKSVRRRLELRCQGASLRLESSADGTRSILDLPVFEMPRKEALSS